ncbi:MAG: hypothetical protein K1X67_13905 [Fimbriimonadaceae bacterium]|nr:hypothetical protein [Fimbriimonadaceae bacterium]
MRSIALRTQRQSGQTLIIAILVLGVLLILGVAFASIISRNITQSGRSQQRTLGGDLADAGIRYAHYQLLYSGLGADWKPSITPLTPDPQGFTKDPDALYLRPRPVPDRGLRDAADPQVDLGGPDGLGPYSRVLNDRGRYLVRVRYAPSDFATFQNPVGNLRRPGRARNFLIIESVGRPGPIRPGDPTTLSDKSVKVANYADDNEYRSSLQAMRLADTRNANQRRLVAMASIGIIESARFITDKYKVTRPAELGYPTDGDVFYEGQPVNVVTKWGGPLPNGPNTIQGTGSMYSNADVVLYGRHDVLLNREIGDMFATAGKFRGADDNSGLILRIDGDANSPYDVRNNTPDSLDSRSNRFSTIRGNLRDGEVDSDPSGYARGVPYKSPPSFLSNDPATNQNRYVVMTRESGALDANGGNEGRFGYGNGVYVDAAERGNANSEDQREATEVSKALPNDWLNPNNPNSIGWQGPYYIPLASYMRLLPDGFEITRDSRSARRYWRQPDGAPTNISKVRYRLRNVGGQVFIINSIVSGNRIDQVNLSDTEFTQNGRPFNGVVCFEGDVRVRGVIPTNIQLTVACRGSIYVEGSITKGIVDERGNVISEPSRSMLMLMAKDFVALNTTQFFGPANGEVPRPKNSDILPDTPSPVELDLSEAPSLTLQAQFLLDPVGNGANPRNPQTWLPYASHYVTFGTGNGVASSLLVSHAADDNGPAFVTLNIAPGTFADSSANPYEVYAFARQLNFGAAGFVDHNAAGPIFSGTGNVPIYGLGNPAINAFPKFESLALPIVTPTFTFANRQLVPPANNAEGNYRLATQDESYLNLRLASAGTFSPKNYALARTAVTPHDIRIEAALFAEEGSFFVIPGPSFNYNPDDSRAAFEQRITDLGSRDLALRDRFERFGVAPEFPFYGEPLDVRVQIIGAISENMPPPISQQTEWLKKWGWIPRSVGGTGRLIPAQHVPGGYDIANNDRFVPNLIVAYDPSLATAGVEELPGQWAPIRVNRDGWQLPPMPMLPVSPTLVYFGDNNP